MKIEHSIACRDCHKALWVGHFGLTRGLEIYADDQAIMRLERFLASHVGHALIFDNCDRFAVDYDEEPGPD